MGQVTHNETCPGKGGGHENEGRSCRREKSEKEEEENREVEEKEEYLGSREDIHAGSEG